MKRFALVIALTVAVALPAAAQQIPLDFPGLEERAIEMVDVTLDASMLRLASSFLGKGGTAEERAARDIVKGLQGVYVRSYSFDRDGAYDRNIVNGVRSRLGPSWKKIVNVKGKKENAEIYIDTRNDVISGLVVIAAEPRELTIVNIVGAIDLEQLSRLEGQFGIPKMSEEKE